MNESDEGDRRIGGKEERGVVVFWHMKAIPLRGIKLYRVYLPFANDKVNAIDEYALMPNEE